MLVCCVSSCVRVCVYVHLYGGMLERSCVRVAWDYVWAEISSMDHRAISALQTCLSIDILMNTMVVVISGQQA